MLYRFREAMLIEAGIKRNPNDPLPSPEACERLPIAEQARKELLREISRKITRIQDATLGEEDLRRLNNELNAMARQKHAWDRRILELGGIQRRSVQLQDRFGLETPNVHGTFFFGRAKELPEAKAVLEPLRENADELNKEGEELQSLLDPTYFGIEGETEELLEEERLAEQHLASVKEPLMDWITGLPSVLPLGLSLSVDPKPFEQHIPSQEEVKKYLLDKRKNALLAKFQ